MIKNAICKLGIVPVRKEPRDASEMISQLLYGDQCYILESDDKWAFLEIVEDGYRGYVDCLQIVEDTGDRGRVYVVQESLLSRNGQYLPMGSTIGSTEISAEDHRELMDSGGIVEKNIKQGRDSVIEKARSLMHSPYLWGGKSALGIDCSGLTQVVFKASGYLLPRDSGDQAGIGSPAELASARTADLAFFSKPGRTNVSHVGFVTETGDGKRIIHASGQVKEDTLTPEGIVDRTGRLTHALLHLRDVMSGS